MFTLRSRDRYYVMTNIELSSLLGYWVQRRRQPSFLCVVRRLKESHSVGFSAFRTKPIIFVSPPPLFLVADFT